MFDYNLLGKEFVLEFGRKPLVYSMSYKKEND